MLIGIPIYSGTGYKTDNANQVFEVLTDWIIQYFISVVLLAC